MKTNKEFSFEELRTPDLHVDALYRGRRSANAGDDPLNKLLGVSLMGGFRYLGNLDALKLVVLTTSLNDPDWPDVVDRETGSFTYFGDNKKPGRALHETPRFGIPSRAEAPAEGCRGSASSPCSAHDIALSGGSRQAGAPACEPLGRPEVQSS